MEERFAQAGVLLHEEQVAGLEAARLGADDLRDGVSVAFGPARQVGDQVEYGSEVREDPVFVCGPSSGSSAERGCDPHLRGRPESRCISSELPSHSANNSKGDVTNVKPVPEHF